MDTATAAADRAITITAGETLAEEA